MAFQSFESLEVWKRSSRLAVQLYQALAHCRDYGLKDQMTRAAVSIPSNIAEGYERGTNAEFIRFLNIAKGSAAELRTQLYIAKEIGAISQESMNSLVQECQALSKMLQALIAARKAMAQDAPVSYLNPGPCNLNPGP